MMHTAQQIKVVLAAGVVLALAACADFVPLKPAAEQVRVAQPGAVAGCTLKGSVRVKVLDKLGPISRDEGKQIVELNTLARNAALDMQADSVVADGPIEQGERNFKLYRCR